MTHDAAAWDAGVEMQLNIYVPEERADLRKRLEEASRRSGRRKNELVLAALETYLRTEGATLPRFRLGRVRPFRRADLYDRRGR